MVEESGPCDTAKAEVGFKSDRVGNTFPHQIGDTAVGQHPESINTRHGISHFGSVPADYEDRAAK